ncbi:MAG: hypothetical protein EBS48_11225, partial [Actinobacteria bacterium]|nr:hypothetical protein [Actinomycetota bacterium]
RLERIPDKDEVTSSILVSPTTRTSVPHRTKGRTVKFIRRVLLVLSIAGSVAGVLRLRGKGGVPAQTGGWQEVTPQR